MKKTILLISFMLSVFNSEANQQKLSEEVDLLFIYLFMQVLQIVQNSVPNPSRLTLPETH